MKTTQHWIVSVAFAFAGLLSDAAIAGTTAVADVKIVCLVGGFVYDPANGVCKGDEDDLKKRTLQAQCKGPELKWMATKEGATEGTCAVAKAPQPTCTPAAWNISYKNKKCVLETDASTEKAKEFFANWAVGIAVIEPRRRTVTDAAIVPAGAASGATATVRVNGEVKQESAMLIARHFYPWNPGRRCAEGGRFSTRGDDHSLSAPVTGFVASCVGMMVAVGLPTSGGVNGQVINFAGLGLAIGSGPATQDDPLAWNIGIGWGRKFNSRVLGDGWAENAPPPEGETQVRYKNIDVGARFVYFTVRW